MEPRQLTLRAGAPTRCTLLAIVRNHHETMAGAERDRPGWDRVCLRLPSGDDVVVDLWTRGEQDIALAPRHIDVSDAGELIRWEPAALSVVPVEPVPVG